VRRTIRLSAPRAFQSIALATNRFDHAQHARDAKRTVLVAIERVRDEVSRMDACEK
jgi:hypothetical protein